MLAEFEKGWGSYAVLEPVIRLAVQKGPIRRQPFHVLLRFYVALVILGEQVESKNVAKDQFVTKVAFNFTCWHLFLLGSGENL